MRHALTLVAMGFSFFFVAIGNIAFATARHIPVFAPIQWLCLGAFVLFTLSGVGVVIAEQIKHTRS